jgi:hypothetical protein
LIAKSTFTNLDLSKGDGKCRDQISFVEQRGNSGIQRDKFQKSRVVFLPIVKKDTVCKVFRDASLGKDPDRYVSAKGTVVIKPRSDDLPC